MAIGGDCTSQPTPLFPVFPSRSYVLAGGKILDQNLCEDVSYFFMGGYSVRFGLSLFTLIAGLILLYLSFQNWYIEWVQERISVDKHKLFRMERQIAIGLTVLGMLQTLSALF